jgi:hypothetical protein
MLSGIGWSRAPDVVEKLSISPIVFKQKPFISKRNRREKDRILLF